MPLCHVQYSCNCGIIYTRFHTLVWWKKNRRGVAEKYYKRVKKKGEARESRTIIYAGG